MHRGSFASRSMVRVAAWLLAIDTLVGCSLVVGSELEGKDFDDARQDGGGLDDDGGTTGATDDGGASGSGGRGGGADGGGDAGDDPGDGGNAGSSGGGGRGGEGGQDQLTVEATDPADGDTTIYRYTELKVMFSEEVDELEDSAIEITHRQSGDTLSGSIETDGEHAYFTPDSPMLVAGDYDVVIDESVATPDGTTLGEDVAFSFRIVPGFADDADWIDASDTPGGAEPDVGVDAEGNAMAIWLQRGPAAGTVNTSPWVARYVHGEGWENPRALNPDAAGTSYSPKIAVARDGAAFAIWTEDSGDVSDPAHVMVARFDPESGWGSPQVVEADEDKSAASQHVAVAVNEAGDAVFGWAVGEDAMAMGLGHYKSRSTEQVLSAAPSPSATCPTSRSRAAAASRSR
jgi:hypothetical protein